MRLKLTTPRSSLGWVLGDLGNALARLGRKLDESVPTVDDSRDWFNWGQEEGRKVAGRASVNMLRLAFDAGQHDAGKRVTA